MTHQVCILAGGKGTRLASVTNGMPKCLVPIAGEPLLVHQLRWLKEEGFRDILILTSPDQAHGEIDDVTTPFHNSQAFSITIGTLDVLRGTAGDVISFAKELSDIFVVVYGDILTNIWLRQMVKVHAVSGVEGTLLVRQTDHPEDSTLVWFDEKQRIKALTNPGEGIVTGKPYANAGIYVLNKHYLPKYPGSEYDFAKHCFPDMLKAGRKLMPYIDPHFCMDIGTPERYHKACQLYENGCLAHTA